MSTLVWSLALCPPSQSPPTHWISEDPPQQAHRPSPFSSSSAGEGSGPMACMVKVSVRPRAGDWEPFSGLGSQPPYLLPVAAMEQSLRGETWCQQAEPLKHLFNTAPQGRSDIVQEQNVCPHPGVLSPALETNKNGHPGDYWYPLGLVSHQYPTLSKCQSLIQQVCLRKMVGT